MWSDRAAIGVLGLGLVACPTQPVDEPDPSEVRWEAWLDERDDALRSLGAPIADCVQQTDTAFPVFGGCWDWHSAVHGVWALHALSAALGEPEWKATADALLTPEAIADELEAVEAGGPFGEVPYGHAWLLRLAGARAEAGHDDLAPHARAAAGHLEDWMEALSPTGWQLAARADDYFSASWALVNLAEHARRTEDDALLVRLQDVAVEHLLPVECSFADESGELDDFFPPCLQRAWALLELLPPAAADQWLDSWLPDAPELEPVIEFPTAHPAGLNFSRAWGLWALHDRTGDPVWRDLALDHVQTHLAMPEFWAEDYAAYSHWVPQFGVLAIERGGI